jgi:energy-coupling factor transport system ATP-binding protein
VGPFHIEDPNTALREIIRMVGLVFQSPESQFFEIYVGDEIAYGPKQFEMESLRERVKSAMDMVGLDFESFKDRRLETLSGGEKRKVALASTLILDQDILLFDEPTAGMDPQARDELLNLFAALAQQGKTIVIASHRLEELAQIAQDLSIMYAGKNLETGPIHKILSHLDTMQSSGLIEPLTVRIGQRLRQLGWPIALEDALTPQRLLKVLQELTR